MGRDRRWTDGAIWLGVAALTMLVLEVCRLSERLAKSTLALRVAVRMWSTPPALMYCPPSRPT